MGLKEITQIKKEILSLTHCGLKIYAHILRSHYQDNVMIELKGEQCSPIKNPFRENNISLKIYSDNGVFLYKDLIEPAFNGDPFDFAAHYYNLKEEDLLQKINTDMNLHIGDGSSFYKANKSNVSSQKEVVILEPEKKRFTFFKAPVMNTVPFGTTSLIDVYTLIVSNYYCDITNYLRAIDDPEEAQNYKRKMFDYVTFSGVFLKRNNKALDRHSGFLTIDFDHMNDLKKLKQNLLQDPCLVTALMFISPSGDGLKWIIEIELDEYDHQENFQAISNYLLQTYGVEMDQSGKDVSRACFLPHDKNAYINPKYLSNEK